MSEHHFGLLLKQGGINKANEDVFLMEGSIFTSKS